MLSWPWSQWRINSAHIFPICQKTQASTTTTKEKERESPTSPRGELEHWHLHVHSSRYPKDLRLNSGVCPRFLFWRATTMKLFWGHIHLVLGLIWEIEGREFRSHSLSLSLSFLMTRRRDCLIKISLWSGEARKKLGGQLLFGSLADWVIC